MCCPLIPPSHIIMLLDAASPIAVAAAAIIVIVTTVLLTYRKRLGFILRAHQARRKLQKIIVEKQTADDTDTANNQPYISAIYIHPIKSLRAVSLSETKFDQHGLLADRRLMIVRPLPTPIYGSFVDGEATHRL